MPSLNDVMKLHKNPVEMLRNSRMGIYVYPVVAPEFQNWRTEQRAWRRSAVLFDQSHHMDELTVEGPQAAEFLSHLGINSFANFGQNRAKHYVPVTPNGHVIGDHIIFREGESRYLLVGRAPTSNWLLFNACYGNWNVRVHHDPRSPSRPDGERVLRGHYRFQIQGPEADRIVARLNGGESPDIPFFHVDELSVGSKPVRALRHGMSGAPGLEIWGPYKDKDYIHSTILQTARDAGVELVQCGSRCYATNTLESGWIPSPLPGIYTGEDLLADYRDWLDCQSYEATGSIGGSFVSDDIEDYYVNPFELGYGFYVGWNKQDFVGKEALLKLKDAPSNRRRVTFEWNRDDVMKVVASAFEDGIPYKWIDFPLSNYASSSADMLLKEDRMVGFSMFAGYSWNERCVLSLGVVDNEIQVGEELKLRWGEPETTSKTSAEPHRQIDIRVRVSPTPYSREARGNYAEGWRTAAT